LPTLFLENEAQINKNNYAMMFFMSKQLSLPKISSILPKIKIDPAGKPCFYQQVLVFIPFLTLGYHKLADTCTGNYHNGWMQCREDVIHMMNTNTMILCAVMYVCV